MFRAPYVMGKPHFRASLYHIDRALRALEPPWPDLILTVGRRPSMAALWVKAQAQGRPDWSWSDVPSAGSTASIW